MRRRNRSSDSSLELLLDTICNTFGGVLFLAILVCVLLRASGSSSSPVVSERNVTETDILEIVRRQREVEAELIELRAAAAAMDRAAELFSKPESGALREQLRKQQMARDDLEKQRLQILADIALRQGQLVKMEQELAELDARLDKARKQALQAEAAVTSEIATRSTTTGPPRERLSLKREVAFVVRHDRFYQWLRYDNLGNSQGLNTDEFVVVNNAEDSLQTAPKPYAGILLHAPGSDRAVIKRLQNFDSHRVHLTLAVWEDSFDQFQKVKAAAVKLGFEYRILAIPSGGNLQDRGSSDNFVQ